MTPEQIEAARAQRIERWAEFLRQQDATPVMCVGLTHPGNELVITCTEEMTGRQVEHVLTGAVGLIRRGRVDYR